MLPDTMICIEISAPGGPDVLKPATRPVPAPAPGQVVIRVAAAGINRPDVLQRQGAYPAPPGASDLPGLEVAGHVAALGEGVDSLAVGDPVCALVAGGGYAHFVAADARHCLPVPAGLDMVQAAALPETFFTVWHNVFERGRLQAGERFLVHGGASGIGTTAIQLAKALGATVFATANGPAKGEACRGLGADRAIDYAAEDFVEVVKAATGGKGVDVILDMVGGDYIARNLKALAADGRLVNIAFQKGSTAELNLMAMMLKRLTLTGSTLRPQSDEAKARMAKALRAQVWPLIEAGTVRPVIHATFPLERAAEAHALMESNTHIGKIVLTV
ncbi:NAD(P)H-quinone oxidoreductase [Magnetospirillum sp. UT-4]|uniref:NAD(P)H-quinone oxidoreductase n=1 Tax=Magnetospirillum sp. UT-4 TaxID=2681467 RepID=UPI00137E5DC5|nr:NAD(P)H-quinone oxidoreductase [Magnetospirillum sp. UT-4]CAA7615076.1 NADPH:quinone reductase and related Zn-dependent oxidoreductase [Magnetospirillum sp. UT-4]